METPAQTDSTPSVARRRAAWRSPTLRVLAVAVVVVLAQWVDTRMQVSSLQQELARRLADGDSMACAEGVDKGLIRAIIRNPHLYYINVHNSEYPAGAVRGQLRAPVN